MIDILQSLTLILLGIATIMNSRTMHRHIQAHMEFLPWVVAKRNTLIPTERKRERNE